LTNTVKHSGAGRVEIELRFGSEHTELVVRDDGRGFGQAANAAAGGHFGLLGIRERVDKMGGTLQIAGNAEGGSEVAVRLPLRVQPARAPTASER
jgi:signal transduction histidine kinase